MNTSILNFIKIGLGTLSILTIALTSAKAQKLSDVQEGSVWAPVVKVDGKLTEWENNLKANNKSTNLTYTIANDAKNLYLAIQSKDITNNNKIMLGGITLTINSAGKKSDKDGFKLTYPIINRPRRPGGGQGGAPGTVRVQGGNINIGQFQDRTQAQRDSIQKAVAKTQLANAKEIKVFGFKEVTDSLISIYNEYGIKALATISETGVFMYEISIPLELLEMSADKPKEFSYNIKINGLQLGSGGFGNFGGGGRPGGSGAGGGGNVTITRVESSGGGGGLGNFNFQDLITPTDFWGKYILTKEN
jgi:hypothetical protein